MSAARDRYDKVAAQLQKLRVGDRLGILTFCLAETLIESRLPLAAAQAILEQTYTTLLKESNED